MNYQDFISTNGADLNYSLKADYRLKAAVAMHTSVGMVHFWDELDAGHRNLVTWIVGRTSNPDAYAYHVDGGRVERVELETLRE